MALKQHNDIVEKLLKKIDEKQSEINSLKKQLNKVEVKLSGVGKMDPSENQSKLNKKINQLHKEYKGRIGTLQQQIRNKSNQAKDLKERLNIKKNQQAKQKQHIAQIVKKSANISNHDPKFAALASHYESLLQKKEKHIASLQKQIKQAFYTNENKQKMMQNSNEDDENYDSLQEKKNNTIPVKILNEQHYHTEYQREINNLKGQVNKFKRIAEEKAKEFKDLTRRYSELTKDYYKILNEYGQKEPKSMKEQSSTQWKKKKASVNPKAKVNTGIANILQEMINEEEQGQQICSDPSLSYSFMSNLSKMQKKGNQNLQPEDRQLTRELQKAENTISSIMEMIGVQLQAQIIPALSKIQAKYEEMVTHENASRFLQSMLYRLGMGKIPTSQLIQQTQKLEQKINKLEEDQDLLNQLCIEAGAKKEKLMDKVKDLKATQQQLFNNMKDIRFMQQLPKANKLIEFIEYFQMDKQICELPEQLKKMYEQLKYVQKFMKHANIILNRSPEGLNKCLDGILRYLERKSAEDSLESATTTMVKGAKKMSKKREEEKN